MKLMTSLTSAMVVLLAGCQERESSSAPQLPGDAAAALISAGVKTPSNAAAVALSDTGIDISWQDDQPDETGFEIYRSTTGNPGTFTLIATNAANVLT